MDIPESHVNYLKFARFEVRQIQASLLGEVHNMAGGARQKWLESLAESCQRTEGYIQQALGEEVTDGEATDKEGVTASVGSE